MKHLPLLILLVLTVGGLYLRANQPAQWNALLAACRAPAPITEVLPVTDQPAPALSHPAATSVADDLPAAPAAAPQPAPESPAPPAAVPEIPAAPVQTTAAATIEPAVPKVWATPDPLPALPNWTWTTRSGATCTNVVVQKVEPDYVTILDDSGSARLNIADLPPDIQKQLNYDPDAARKATLDRAKEASDASVAAAATAAHAATELTQADRDQINEQISDLRKDIGQKLREIASVYARDGYARSVGSQSSFRDTVVDETTQLNALEKKMGQPLTSPPTYYPFYPYYLYPY